MENEMVQIKLDEIIYERSRKKIKEYCRDEKLLSDSINIQIRELVLILCDIEKEFGIIIPESNIVDKKIDTYNKLFESIVFQIVT